MITLPPAVIKFGHKATNWIIKNGPMIMNITGAGMTIAGGVMACQATLKVDEVLDAHKERMKRAQAAKQLSDEMAQRGELTDVEQAFTEKDLKRAKFEAYRDTGIELVKLYGPSVAMAMGGIGMMEAAFGITEKRRSTAVAALTSMSEAYNSVLAQAQEQGVDIQPMAHEKVKVKTAADENETEHVVVDPDSCSDPFFFMFDEHNPNWSRGNSFLLNERFITANIDAMNYQLSSHAVSHYLVEDFLKRTDMFDGLDSKQKALAHFHGWNAGTGDIIEYTITPYLIEFGDEDSEQFPMYIKTDMDSIRELEASDIQTGYCFGIRLYSSSDGYENIVEPRMIYNEIYGE